MSLKKLTTNELIERLGIVLEQIQVVKRGLREHPEDEVFQKAVVYFIDMGKELMKEITKRNEADK